MIHQKPYLTMHYIAARMIEKAFRALHPGLPWLSPKSIRFLQAHIRPEWVGFEYGSGRSTLWLADRISSLTSVEHDKTWFTRISHTLRTRGLSNVAYHFRQREETREPEGIGSEYVALISEFPDNHFDFVLVDGVYRAECARCAVQKIKPGGLLILDDAHRYLPSASKAPYAIKISDAPLTKRWSLILERLKTWKCVWTSNGVSDTALYIKPGGDAPTI